WKPAVRFPALGNAGERDVMGETRMDRFSRIVLPSLRTVHVRVITTKNGLQLAGGCALLAMLAPGAAFARHVNRSLGHADAAAFFVDSTGTKRLMHNDDPFVGFGECLNIIDLDGQFFWSFP